MKPHTSADITAVFGMPGMGKSTIVRHQVAPRNRVLIHDPAAWPDWGEIAEPVTGGLELAERLTDKGPMRICWRGANGKRTREDAIAAFELGNEAAVAAGDLTLVWDEVDRFTAPGSPLPPLAYLIANESRHSRIRLYILARRPARVNRDLTSYANRMIVFRTQEPADIKYFRERSAELAEVIPTLPDYHAADWSVKGGVVVKKSPFR